MCQEKTGGPDAAQRRTIDKGAGYPEGEIRNKPQMGIAHASNEASPARARLRALAEAAKPGVWAAGGDQAGKRALAGKK